MPTGKRIVIATIGSLGDLHPCMALALELQRRKHSVTIASTEFYRNKVTERGIGFRAIRPDWDPTDRSLIAQCEELKRGPEILFRKLLLPHLKHTYEDLLLAAEGADLMIAGELVFAAPLVAEKLGLRWASAILSPCSFLSSYDPSVLVNVPNLMRLHRAGRVFYRTALQLGRWGTRHWWTPVRRLRREQALKHKCDPLFRDKFSPDLVLALFSDCFAQAQPDWPEKTVQAGFAFYDGQRTDEHCVAKLRAFLTFGDPPIVFTLGSTAVHDPGNFYEASVEAAKQLGRRAVLLGIDDAPGGNSPDILALRYAPYSEIFPRAAAIVHQGGSGSTGQALRAGRPMLIVPYGWDQPDNGARVARLGAGVCLARSEYSARSAAEALKRLMEDAQFTRRASELRVRVQEEDGTAGACDAIESLFVTEN